MHMIFATVGREGREGVSDLPLVACDSDRACKGTYSRTEKGKGWEWVRRGRSSLAQMVVALWVVSISIILIVIYLLLQPLWLLLTIWKSDGSNVALRNVEKYLNPRSGAHK